MGEAKRRKQLDPTYGKHPREWRKGSSLSKDLIAKDLAEEIEQRVFDVPDDAKAGCFLQCLLFMIAIAPDEMTQEEDGFAALVSILLESLTPYFSDRFNDWVLSDSFDIKAAVNGLNDKAVDPSYWESFIPLGMDEDELAHYQAAIAS